MQQYYVRTVKNCKIKHKKCIYNPNSTPRGKTGLSMMFHTMLMFAWNSYAHQSFQNKIAKRTEELVNMQKYYIRALKIQNSNAQTCTSTSRGTTELSIMLHAMLLFVWNDALQSFQIDISKKAKERAHFVQIMFMKSIIYECQWLTSILMRLVRLECALSSTSYAQNCGETC
jgi:hypothetical protein